MYKVWPNVCLQKNDFVIRKLGFTGKYTKRVTVFLKKNNNYKIVISAYPCYWTGWPKYLFNKKFNSFYDKLYQKDACSLNKY